MAICMGDMNIGAACNDFNDCTKGDKCMKESSPFGDYAFCEGTLDTEAKCNDYNDCTENDRCMEITNSRGFGLFVGCRGTLADGKSCDDYNKCTTDDVCKAGDGLTDYYDGDIAGTIARYFSICHPQN